MLSSLRGGGVPKRAAIGRERELELLESVFAGAKSNRVPAIARILGDSGIGKTFALSQLARNLESSGWFVVRTTCHTIQQHTPRLVSNRIVSAAIERLGSSSPRYTGGLEEALAGFDAGIARAIGCDAPAQPIDGDGYVSTFVRLFEGIAVDHDVAILCDDAQWMDPESAKAIVALPEKISTGSVCIALAERGTQHTGKPEWPASIDVTLTELDLERSLALIADVLPNISAQVAVVIAQHAGGNPFELTTICEELRENGSAEIERSLRARTAKQLAALDPDVREFVQICALLGDPIEHRVLSEMYPDSATLERLISKSERYVINAGYEFCFKHAMLAQSVVSTIAVPIPLRRRIIDALQSPNLQELYDYERIAENAAECGDLQLQRRALTALAKDAYGRQAWVSAMSACERALQIRRTDALDPEFLSLYVLALRVFEREPEAVEFLLPELSRFDLSELPGIGGLIGLLIAMLAELCRFDEALAVYRRYEQVIRQPTERAPLIAMMMWSASSCVDEPLYRELCGAFDSLGDVVPTRLVATRKVIDASFASLRGDSDEVRRAVATAFANIDLGDARHPWLLNFTRMFFEFREAGCSAFTVRLKQLKEFFIRDAVDFWFYGRLCEASAAFFSGDWKLATEIVASSYRTSMPTARAAKMLGIAAAMEAISGWENPLGAETEAVAVACWQERDAQSAMHVLPWWLQKHSHPEVESFNEQLAAELEKHTAPFFAVSYVPLGFASWAAVRSKKDILERIATTEAPLDRSNWGTAQWELARGAALQSLGRAEAKSVLRSAKDAFRSLSSPVLAALASRYAGNPAPEDRIVLASVGFTETKSAPKQRRPTDLTAREWDVAHQVGAGSTNRQTAENLFVSERTVEVHLSNIFGKLGLTSRAQLVRWLYENDGKS